jgi:large subunit ribosomal protein L10
MSKPIKNMVTDSYRRRFDGVDGGVIVDLCGVASNDNNHIRNALAKEGMRVTIVKNSLAMRAFEGTDLEGMSQVIDGPSALVYGGDSVVVIARQLVDLIKEVENLELKGALMEGEVFKADQIEALSKYPTRQEAQSQLLSMILGAGGQLISATTSGGSNIASILKAMEEKLEKGETIAAA